MRTGNATQLQARAAMPPVSTDRFIGQWDLLAKLAEWLRASRASQYATMVAKGRLTVIEAEMDREARAAIEADWRAVSRNVPRCEIEPDCSAWTKRWALRLALAKVEERLTKLGKSHPDFADHVDLRDAIATLLHYQRSPSGGPLAWQAVARERAAAPLQEAA